MQRLSSTTLLFIVVALIPALVGADDSIPRSPDPNTRQLNLGMGCPEFQHKFDGATPDSATPFQSFTITKSEEYEYIQLHLVQMLLPQGCIMALRSVEGFDTPDKMINLTNQYPSGKLHENVIAPSLRGKEFRIEFYRDQVTENAGDPGDDQCFGFAIDYYYYALVKTKKRGTPSTESICMNDNTMEAICYYANETTRPAFFASMAVARLLTTDSTGNTRACTGWLLGNSGHLITNHHCIHDADEASTTNAEFMAEASACNSSVSCESWGACSGTTPAVSLTFKYTNPSLDFTIVQLVAEKADLKPFGYLRLQNAESTVNQQVYIPQHPLYYGKRISLTDDYSTSVSIINASAVGCNAAGFSYSGDTQGGSSGSPVIDAQKHSVLGLHFCGVYCENIAIPAIKIIADLSANAGAIGGDPATFDMVDNGQGGNEGNFGSYTPPKQEAEAVPLRSQFKFDGGIQLSEDSKTVSVDHITFDLFEDGDVAFDIVSAEISDNNTFVDVNQDCKATYMDAVIFLFPSDSSSQELIRSNDDRSTGGDVGDGSVSFRDPYIKTFLKQGSYLLAIASMGTTTEEAYNGSHAATSTPELYNCRSRGDYGSYRIEISSSGSINITDKPSSNVTIDPAACQTPAASICSR